MSHASGDKCSILKTYYTRIICEFLFNQSFPKCRNHWYHWKASLKDLSTLHIYHQYATPQYVTIVQSQIVFILNILFLINQSSDSLHHHHPITDRVHSQYFVDQTRSTPREVVIAIEGNCISTYL